MDMFRLDGQTAVVTGGGSGLGATAATALALAGAAVAVVDRNHSAAVGVAEQIEEAGGVACALEFDVTDRVHARTFADTVANWRGRLDVLVNSAGIGGWSPAEDYPDELWDRVLDVNLTGMFSVCRAIGGVMLARGSGSIINVASILGVVGMAGTVGYLASKGGVVQLTRGLAIEWASRGIRVNAVAPTTFTTPLMEANRPARPEVYDRIVDLTPVHRFGKPSEIAGPIVFLASPAASLVTGAVLPVDGGYTAQ